MASKLRDEWMSEEGLLQVTQWAREKLDNKAIAKNIGIGEKTFYEWQNQFPQFRKAIKKGRAPVIAKIEETAYQRCDWKQVEEEVEEIQLNPDGTKVRKIRRTKKWIPPDTALLIFMLKNIAPNRFSDRPKVEETKALEKLDGILEKIGGVI